MSKQFPHGFPYSRQHVLKWPSRSLLRGFPILTRLRSWVTLFRRTISNRIMFWAGIAISIIFVSWAVRGLRLAEVWDNLAGANYWWLIPGILIYFFGVWARTWRWHYMLRPFKVISLARLFPMVCIGYAGNNIYPARAGEVLRSYVLKRTDDIPMSTSLATVFVERLFDGLVMIMFVFVALPFTASIPKKYSFWVIGFSLLFIVALIVFLIIAARPQLARRLYDLVARLVIPARFQDKMGDIVDRFLEGLASLRSGRDVLMIFVTSTVVWLAETMKYWFVMHAFDFEVSFFVLMLMNGVVNLFTTIPAAPGYIGTFDAPGVEILNVVGGVARPIAFSYTIVLHAALWIPITALGVFYLYRERLNWSDVERVSQGEDIVPETSNFKRKT